MHSVLQVPASTPQAPQTPALLPLNHSQSDGRLQRTSHRSRHVHAWVAMPPAFSLALGSFCVLKEPRGCCCGVRQWPAGLAVGRSQNYSGILPVHVH